MKGDIADSKADGQNIKLEVCICVCNM